MSAYLTYKATHLEVELLQRAHPALRQLLLDFAAWSVKQELPPVVVTCVGRDRAFMRATYVPYYLRRGCTLAEAQKKAEARFSWHMVFCAADLRNKHYSREQRRQVMEWLRQRTAEGNWELLEHDVGAGDHIHLGVRDEAWRNRYAPRAA